ncbi:MAG: ArsR/SmtB family transcription factor [Candidatus Krumholzibacteriia bacterium]
MVNYLPGELDRTFAALADPTRRAIVARLAQGEASVSELADPFRVSLPAITKHLSVLERAGLVESRKIGRVRRCRLQPKPMRRASEWIELHRHFWQQRFDALDRYLKHPRKEKRR